MKSTPCHEALMTGTFALMTTWAQTPPDQAVGCASAPVVAGPGAPPRTLMRDLLARKIVSNLFFLMHHHRRRPRQRTAWARRMRAGHSC